MRWLLLAVVVVASLVAGCGDSGTTRAETRVEYYRHDPLTKPVDIGLALGDPPDTDRHHDEDTLLPVRSGRDDVRLVYWFEVPAGSDRDALLDLATIELVERGWDLVVETHDVRMLTASQGTDDLRTTIVMPESDSARLVQEIRIGH